MTASNYGFDRVTTLTLKVQVDTDNSPCAMLPHVDLECIVSRGAKSQCAGGRHNRSQAKGDARRIRDRRVMPNMRVNIGCFALDYTAQQQHVRF